MIICACMNVTEEEINKYIRRGCSIQDIASITGATTDCKACEINIQGMINKYESTSDSEEFE